MAYTHRLTYVDLQSDNHGQGEQIVLVEQYVLIGVSARRLSALASTTVPYLLRLQPAYIVTQAAPDPSSLDRFHQSPFFCLPSPTYPTLAPHRRRQLSAKNYFQVPTTLRDIYPSSVLVQPAMAPSAPTLSSPIPLPPSSDADDVADPSVCNGPSPHSPSSTSSSPSSPPPSNVLALFPDVSYTPLTFAPITTIPYSAHFRAVFGLLRAVRARKEFSSRALALTGEAIRLCLADYTSWGFRQDVVRGLVAGGDSAEILAAEDAFVRATAKSSPKSYQSWEYRRFLYGLRIECGDGGEALVSEALAEEKAVVEDVLAADAKNYHAWSHRAWLCRCEGEEGVDEELVMTGACVRNDVRNNSAFSHRWAGGRGKERGVGEIEWALDRMRKAPRNEAVWNYVIALSKSVEGGGVFAANVAREEIEGDEGNVAARRCLVLCGGGEEACSMEERVGHCRKLATEFDVERYRYWMWKIERLSAH